MTKFDQAAFDAKYAVYKYVNEHVVVSGTRAPVDPVVVQNAAKELWGWLTETPGEVTISGTLPINISDHITTYQPATSVLGPIAPTKAMASNFSDAINDTAERIRAVVELPTGEPIPPPSMRQKIMAHLHAMGADGATIVEIREAISAVGSDVGKRMREMLDRGEVVKDDQMPTRYWAKEYAVKPVMPPVPLQKHTKIDGSPLSSVMPDAGKLTHQALVALEIIRRPGTQVSIGGPMDIPTGCMSLGQAKRAFSELERLGFIGKLDGVWVALGG